MATNKKQQKGLVIEDLNTVELPMIDGDGPKAGACDVGVDIATNDDRANLG